MTQNHYIQLPHRSVIEISGKDRKQFLQGLITNDMAFATQEHAIYALMLTPQGKCLYDFFILTNEEGYLLDVPAIHKDAILKKFAMYKLRSDVEMKDQSDRYTCAALFGDKIYDEIAKNQENNVKVFCKGIAYLDPRKEGFGARAIIETENNFQSFEAKDFSKATLDEYHSRRIEQVIPEADIDFISGEHFPLDFGLDHLHAISFEKGCYVGQEVTARVHHKSAPKRGIFKVKADSAIKATHGEPITVNGMKAGEICSVSGHIGLALLRKADIENVNKAELGGQAVTIIHT